MVRRREGRRARTADACAEVVSSEVEHSQGKKEEHKIFIGSKVSKFKFAATVNQCL